LRYPRFIQVEGDEVEGGDLTALAAETDTLLKASNDFRLFDFSLGTESNAAAFSPALMVHLHSTSDTLPRARLRSGLAILDVPYDQASREDVKPLAARIAQEISNVFQDEHESLSYLLADTPLATGREATLSPQDRSRLDARTTRAFKYASIYHLTFSLFSSSSLPSAWEVEEALAQYISPLVARLSAVSQMTIETQVQLHASFSPSIAGPIFDADSNQWKLRKTDLSGFINAAEWPLSPSIGSGPTINFVLYVPSPEQSPLVVAETGGNSWLIPQWGGVQIFDLKGNHSQKLSANDLQPVMLVFADQLTALLGLPPSPPSLTLRISSLTRERATSLILSASSTLGALSRLTHKLTSIAIPDSVAKSVDETIQRLDQACSDLREGRFDSALQNARIANDEAERAFFEPSMVGQVYFPDEHKVAVYVPLLGPMAVPLVMAAVKEIRARARKAKTA